MSRRPAPPRGRAAPPTARRGGSATARPGRPAGARSTPSTSRRPDGARPGAARPRAPLPAPEVPETRSARIARVLSVRALALGVVLLVAFSVLLPTVRAYLGQRAELDALAQQVAAAEQNQQDLQAELDRWGDDAYVVARARERLSFVMPGETAYRVIDPEVVTEPPAVENDSGVLNGPTMPAGGALQPWYATVWESVQIAGEAPVGETAEDDGTRGDDQTGHPQDDASQAEVPQDGGSGSGEQQGGSRP